MDENSPPRLVRADLAPEQALIDAIRTSNTGRALSEEVDRSWLRVNTNFKLGDVITICRTGPRDITRGRAAVLTLEVVQPAIDLGDIPRFRGHYSGSSEIDLTDCQMDISDTHLVFFYAVQGQWKQLIIQSHGETILVFVKRKADEDDGAARVCGITALTGDKLGDAAEPDK